VQYEIDLVHAVDGLGMGLLMIPVNGNFLVKIYDTNHLPKGSNVTENFTNVVKPLLELAALFLKT
jgi:hypothetical protein